MLLRSALILVSSLAFAGGAFAQEPATEKPCTEPSCPIAKRGTAVITVADVTAKVKALEPKQQSALLSDPKQLNKMLENLLILRQIANEVDAAKVEQDVLLQARLKMAYDEIVAVYRLDQIRAERVTADFSTLAHEHYLTHMSEMKTPKQLTVRHLLVESRKVGEAAAKAKAEQLAAQLRGADQKRFSEMVMEVSDDPSKTGNAGLFHLTEGTTEMDQEFLAGALALTEVGQISPPVHSQFGYHLIQLIELTPAKVVPFEQAKPAIVEKLRSEANRKVVTEYRTDMTVGTQLEFFPKNLEGLVFGEDAATDK